MPRLVAAAALAWSLLAIMALALTAPVSRDESMYLAAGSLLADLTLYADFHFLQPPLAAWFHGLVLRLWPGPEVLLPARLAQMLVTLGLAAVLLRLYRRVEAGWPLAAGLVLLLVHTEVVRASAGLARNYELALLLSLAPWLVMPLTPYHPRAPWRWLLGGLLAGLAVVVKLTHAAPALLALAWPLLAGRDHRAVGWTVLGGLGGLALATPLLAGADPVALRFDLVDYHLANARFHALAGLGQGLDAADKWRHAVDLMRRTDLLAGVGLVAAALVLGVRGGLVWRCPGCRLGAGLLAAGVMLVAVPRPVQTSYYALLLVGGTVLVAATVPTLEGRDRRLLHAVAAIAVLAATAHHLPDDGRLLADAARPSRWPAQQAQRAGRRLAEVLARRQPGPVVATQLLPVLEGGLALDPAFATGEFVWRLGGAYTGPAPAVTTATFDAHAAANPPAAVVTAAAAPWDGPLSDWARARGWRTYPVVGGVVVWLPD